MAQLDLLGPNDSAVPPSQALPPFFSQKKVMISEPIEAHSAKAEGAYKTISEVAEELDVPTHVLRFWESRFPQVKPQRMRGGRRYYRPADIDMLKKIKTLLYSQGYTIKGAKKHVKDKGHEIHMEAAIVAAPVVAKAPVAAMPVAPAPVIASKSAIAAKKTPPAELGVLLSELRDLRKKLLAFH